MGAGGGKAVERAECLCRKHLDPGQGTVRGGKKKSLQEPSAVTTVLSLHDEIYLKAPNQGDPQLEILSPRQARRIHSGAQGMRTGSIPGGWL